MKVKYLVHTVENDGTGTQLIIMLRLVVFEEDRSFHGMMMTTISLQENYWNSKVSKCSAASTVWSRYSTKITGWLFSLVIVWSKHVGFSLDALPNSHKVTHRGNAGKKTKWAVFRCNEKQECREMGQHDTQGTIKIEGNTGDGSGFNGLLHPVNKKWL